MRARCSSVSGYILQLILGFGIGVGSIGDAGVGGGNPGNLDFSYPANGGPIAALRRF